MKDIAFHHDGVAFKAFPEAGSYFGAQKNPASKRGRMTLLQVPMLVDGSPEAGQDGTPNMIEVSNMHEDGDTELLTVINAELGTTLRQSDFAGR